jgi:hypothetical protein
MNDEQRLRYFPPLSASSVLLIRAAGADRDVAVESWTQWSAIEWPDGQPPGPERTLLPTVAWNLQAAVGQSDLKRALQSRRNVANANLLAVARLQKVLAILSEADVAAIVLKGGALLSSACYGDLAARRMADFDLLVAPEHVETALRVLGSAGQRRFGDHISLSTLRSVMHAAALQGPLGELDLHWSLLPQSRNAEADRFMFSTAQPARLGTIALTVPSPTQLMFHVLAHGRFPDLRWLVDAVQVLKRGGVDPVELAEVARQRKHLRVVQVNAHHVHEMFRSPLTAALCAELDAAEPRRGDDLHLLFTDPGTRRSRAAALVRFADCQLSDRNGLDRVRFLRELACFSTGVQSLGQAVSRLTRYAALNQRRPESPLSKRSSPVQ